MERIKEIRETFITILKKPEMQILPGQIAFYFLMSIIPIVVISAIAASYITNNFDFANTLHSVIPDSLANILLSLSDNMKIQGVAIVTILYMILASNAPGSIIIASNMLYKVKQPRYIKLKIKSFIMTIMIVLLLLFVVLIPLLGDIIIEIIVKLINSDILYSYGWIYQIIKVFASYLIIYTVIKLLYTIAPDAKIKSSTTTVGTIFTTMSWIIVTFGFGFYITNIASYDVVYGNFANVLILLTWVYLLAYLFVIGMAINVDNFQKQEEGIYETKEKPEKRKRVKEIKNKASKKERYKVKRIEEKRKIKE